MTQNNYITLVFKYQDKEEVYYLPLDFEIQDDIVLFEDGDLDTLIEIEDESNA